MFDKQSAHNYIEMIVKMCFDVATKWGDSSFEDEKLAGHRERPMKDIEVKIPVLSFDKREGKRRKESVEGRDRRMYDRNVIDVFIPFVGDSVAFDISPSTKTLGARGSVSSDHIVLSFDDDDRLEQNLDGMVKMIEGNLQHLGRDLSSLPAQVSSAVDTAIRERKAQIDRKRELDAKRSFPIR